jgi:hypothetical protein
MALLAGVYTQTYPSDVTDAEWAVLEPLVTPTTRLAMSEQPRRLRRDCIPNRQPHPVLSRGDLMVIHLLSLSVGSWRVGVGGWESGYAPASSSGHGGGGSLR